MRSPAITDQSIRVSRLALPALVLFLLAAGCAGSRLLGGDDVEDALRERLSSETGATIYSVRCTGGALDENMNNCFVRSDRGYQERWCAGFVGDELYVRQGRCDPTNAELRLQEYEKLKEERERTKTIVPEDVG